MRRSYNLLRVLLGCAAVFTGWIAFSPLARSAGAPDFAVEYRIKAAYLYNFTKFIDWPPQEFSSAADPFVLGVLDSDGEVARIIQDALDGKKTSGGREIKVLRLQELGTETDNCHQIFVTRSSPVTLDQLRKHAATSKLVLVGETSGFAENGGTIGFLVAADGVRFQVNLAGAQRAGVKVSGRLASVAQLVREVPRR